MAQHIRVVPSVKARGPIAGPFHCCQCEEQQAEGCAILLELPEGWKEWCLGCIQITLSVAAWRRSAGVG
eukprot:2224070-Prorocentrum_lima.AAC.1